MDGVELENKAQIDEALKQISKKELAKLLRESGRRMVRQYKIFQSHWQKGQGSWSPPSPAYAKWLAKKYGNSGKFQATGQAAKLLATEPKRSGDGLIMTVSKKYNSISIHLRKMIKGQNVYAMAQRGRFKGVTKSDGSTVSAADVREHNAQTYREYSGAKERGSTAKLSTIAARRAKEKGMDGATRASNNSRPITRVEPEDIPSIQKALMDEIQITLKMRGLL